MVSPIPRGPHLGVLAKTRPRHHSGPIRGVVPGTARIRETTALGGAEPIADKDPRSGPTGVTRLPDCRARGGR